MFCFCLLVSCCVSGCASLSGIFGGRTAYAVHIAGRAGFSAEVMETPVFRLQAFSRISTPGGPLKIYIEGDGLSWLSRTQISRDPTPVHPVALELAADDPSDNVVYLARPCQYVEDPACQYEYWTSARFSEEVIESFNAALDIFKERAGSSTVELTGFSGGGAVVLLLAARRHDVSAIRTVAGNLDPQALNRYHTVSPLSGSLDPLDVALRISHIPQWHFVAEKDRLVPSFVAENFKRASGSPDNIHIIRVKGASHMEGWKDIWQSLLTGQR